MSKTRLFIISAVIVTILSATGIKSANAQLYSVKTNIPALIVTNLNVGFEMSVAKQFSLEFPVYVNPWKYNDRYAALYGVVQPGVRYWFYECFTGPFVGAQGGFGVGQVKFKGTDYRGYFGSAGLSFGYAWMLNVRWNLEAEVGAGRYWLNYKTKGANANRWWPSNRFVRKEIWGPTRLGLNLVYLF